MEKEKPESEPQPKPASPDLLARELRRRHSTQARAGMTGTSSPSGSLSDLDGLEEICDMFRTSKGKFSADELMELLRDNGIQADDPRLTELVQHLKQHGFTDFLKQTGRDPSEHLHTRECDLDRDQFKNAIMQCMELITKAMNNEFVIPKWAKFIEMITDLYEKCKLVTGGKNADYIPELARVNPAYWGVAVCTIHGQRHVMGDAKVPFCIQSISKAFTYAININDLGAKLVHEKIGTEPSGRLFNAICLDKDHKPHNPMINAGAIVCTSLVRPDHSQADRLSFILNQYSRIAGNSHIAFSPTTYLSERETADRNYALSHYMREFGNFDKDSDLRAILEFYFQLCSIEVTAESLSIMAATLANGGICPVTGEQALSNEACRHTLSLMHLCGMYDYSGNFAFRVGLPAKSGVGGGIIVVVPNVCGFATFSPPLDTIGNSVKGIKFFEEIVSVFNFHNFDNLVQGHQKYDPRLCNQNDHESRIINVTSVLLAVHNGSFRTLRGFMLKGVDLNEQDYDGRTALHVAASCGRADMAKFLLKNGANPHILDRWCHKPLDNSVAFGHCDCETVLRAYEPTTITLGQPAAKQTKLK